MVDTTSIRVPTPCEAFAHNALSPVHDVEVDPLPTPIRNDPLYPCGDWFHPTIVTSCDPVAATFDAIVPLTSTPSIVIASVKLPYGSTAVNVTDLHSSDPACILPRVAESDTHVVAASELPPMRMTDDTVQ
jgi:hypothetical protein